MIDNIPAEVAIPLAIVLWLIVIVQTIRGWRKHED